MYAREQQGLGSEEERTELLVIRNVIKYHTQRARTKWVRQWDEQAAIERLEAEKRRLKREELLAARAQEQRVEIDPRDAIRARLEHVITQPVLAGTSHQLQDLIHARQKVNAAHGLHKRSMQCCGCLLITKMKLIGLTMSLYFLMN